jgi:hypothetical protein
MKAAVRRQLAGIPIKFASRREMRLEWEVSHEMESKHPISTKLRFLKRRFRVEFGANHLFRPSKGIKNIGSAAFIAYAHPLPRRRRW